MPSSNQTTPTETAETHDPPDRRQHSYTARKQPARWLATLPDRRTYRQLLDGTRAVSVGSVGAVIVITYLATLGRGVETNPVTRTLIEQGGWGITALVSIGTTAVVYEFYTRLITDLHEFPEVSLVAASAGVLLAVFNFLNLLNDLHVLYVVGLPETLLTVELLWLLCVVSGLTALDTAGDGFGDRDLVSRVVSRIGRAGDRETGTTHRTSD
jgi:hypothetical protein